MEDEGSAMADQLLMQQHLPDDLIVSHILTKLPIKSLLRFKLVSKQWYSTLSSPQFALAYTRSSPFFNPSAPIQFLLLKNGNNFYLFSHDNDADDVVEGEISTENCNNFVKLGFDYDDENVDYDENLDAEDVDYYYKRLNLIGTCNGLVCLASISGSFFILWNPIIGKFRKYSDSDFVFDPSNPIHVLWGFGYVSSVDDYKIIRITELGASLEIRVHVFSLRSKKWTRIADELHEKIFSLKGDKTYRSCHGSAGKFPYAFHMYQGILVKETLYWITSKINSESLKIVSFDLVSEKFHNHMNLDDMEPIFLCDDKFLFVMGGCLSRYTLDFGCRAAEIKIYKCPGMVETTGLVRDDVNDSPHCLDIVGFTRTGKFFILLGLSTLGLVDPSSDSVKYVHLSTFDSPWDSRIVGYVPSLTLPYIAD